jgi:hypothetical protein
MQRWRPTETANPSALPLARHASKGDQVARDGARRRLTHLAYVALTAPFWMPLLSGGSGLLRRRGAG